MDGKMKIKIRQLEESDLASADRMFRLAFGTFLGLPDPMTSLGDTDNVKTRFLANPTSTLAAESANGKLVGFNILTTQNGITQREIADKLGSDTSSLIPLIDRLEAKELVERKPDPSDRRINRLYLTKKAEALLGPMHSCVLSIRKILTRGIHRDQLEIIEQVLERINENLVNHYGLYAKDNNIIVESRLVDNSPSKKRI
jgi:DNA-binding MarR family transcriptional regulator